MKKITYFLCIVCIFNFSCGGGEVKTDGHADGVYEEDFFEETMDIQKDLIDVQEDLIGETADMESEVPITCGNGIVDDGEECDDEKNGNPDDGCTDECRYSCHVDSDCSDGEICNGEEVCNLEYHVCSEGTPHEDGFVCLNEPRSICLNGECRESICGDGFIDSGAGEFCDPPGNNGCKEDCTFECNNDFECYNDEVCDGEEFCDLTTHTCAHRNVPPEGAECGTSPRKICLGGRCQASVCGDTFVDMGSFEECDDGDAIEGDGCDNDCTFSCHSNSECDDGHICTDDICNEVTHTCRNPLVPRSFLNCRPAAGECDIPEYCDGIHPDCPSDMLSPSTTLCRPSAGICDVAEYCTGSSPFCPADGFLSSDTVCRPSAGPCDVAEHCTGTSVECPVDSFLSSDTVCRPSAGDCDIAEYCTGTSAACPRDAFLPSTTVCRPSTGPCDAEEYCTGSSATCPPDAPPPVETCNGLDDDCDGVCDDGFGCCRGTTESCTTTCGTTGTKTCSNWCTWGSCVPPTETCNGIDDDCDGTCDNGFECCQRSSGTCTTTCGSVGTHTCSSSCSWEACVPPTETCNGRDDDCDGACDEDFTCCAGSIESCITSCGTNGTKTCSNSCTWSSCVPPAETCNGMDDDCDTLVDEGSWGLVGSRRRLTMHGAAGGDVDTVWTGTEIGAAWRHDSGGRYVTVATVQLNGSIRWTVQNLDWVSWGNYEVAIAYTGSSFGVVYRRMYDGIYYSLVDVNGNVLRRNVRITGSYYSGGDIQLAWNGTDFGLIYWEGSLRFLRFNISGIVTFTPIIVATGGSPDIVWVGDGYRYCWVDGDPYVGKLDAEGNVFGTPVRLSTLGNASDCRIASGPAGIAVVWSRQVSAYNWDVYVSTMTRELGSISTQIVASSSNIEDRPNVTARGSDLVVVWRGNEDPYYRRLFWSSSDSTFDGGSVNVASLPRDINRPAVVRADPNFAVIWVDNSTYDVYFQLIGCP